MGISNRLTEALSHLHADDLRALADDSIELAQGLGEKVVVAGFSLGGSADDVGRAAVSGGARGCDRAVFRRVVDAESADGAVYRPDTEIAQYFRLVGSNRTRAAVPAHGYPRYASHAVGQALLLGREVFARADHAVAARELILVVNARETAVNNRAVRKLAGLLRAAPGGHIEQVVLTSTPLSHDIIEPLRRPEVADRVFPELLDLIDRPL